MGFKSKSSQRQTQGSLLAKGKKGSQVVQWHLNNSEMFPPFSSSELLKQQRAGF